LAKQLAAAGGIYKATLHRFEKSKILEGFWFEQMKTGAVCGA